LSGWRLRIAGIAASCHNLLCYNIIINGPLYVAPEGGAVLPWRWNIRGYDNPQKVILATILQPATYAIAERKSGTVSASFLLIKRPAFQQQLCRTYAVRPLASFMFGM
jgi:hypothetical protein